MTSSTRSSSAARSMRQLGTVTRTVPPSSDGREPERRGGSRGRAPSGIVIPRNAVEAVRAGASSAAGARPRGAHVDDALRDAAAAVRDDEPRGAVQTVERRLGVRPALEAVRGVRVHPERPRRLADGARMEVRALEEDRASSSPRSRSRGRPSRPRGRRASRRRRSRGAAGRASARRRRASRASLPSSRAARRSSGGRRPPSRACRGRRRGAAGRCPRGRGSSRRRARRSRPARSPRAARRRSRTPAGSRSPSITRAEYREQSAGSATTTAASVPAAGPASGTGTARLGVRERAAQRDRRLAREAAMVHAVRTVRGDLDVVDGRVAVALDALDDEADGRQSVADLLRVRRAGPAGTRRSRSTRTSRQAHTRSRNRTSFSKKRRRSGTP